MFVCPSKILFENQTDIIDYVSQGIPPTRNDFVIALKKVRDIDNIFGSPVEKDIVCNVLSRVYENRRSRWIKGATTLAIGVLATFAICIQRSRRIA